MLYNASSLLSVSLSAGLHRRASVQGFVSCRGRICGAAGQVEPPSGEEFCSARGGYTEGQLPVWLGGCILGINHIMRTNKKLDFIYLRVKLQYMSCSSDVQFLPTYLKYLKKNSSQFCGLHKVKALTSLSTISVSK